MLINGKEYSSEVVNRNQLSNGDVVFDYNCIFRLKDGHKFDCSYSPDGYAQAFKTDLLEIELPSVMPESWSKDWTVQGNANARITRLLDYKVQEA